MKFLTDISEVYDGFLRSLAGIFVKFKRDFCDV